MNALALVQSDRRLTWESHDALLAGSVALVCELDVWFPLPFVGHQQHRLALGLVFLVTSASLVFRRRAPLAVLAFIYTVNSLLYLAIGAPEALGTFLPPLIALYSVGRYSETRNIVLAGPLALIGTALHEVQDPQFTLSGPAIFFWAMVAGAWPLGHALRVRDQAVVDLERRREAAAREAEAAERARIARELHDVVGHGISVIVLQLVALSGMLEKGEGPPALARLRATERSARETLAEMRRLLGLLDEDEEAALAPQPGLRDLHKLVADTRAAGVPVDLTVEGDPLELAAGLDLAVYRVAQEALTNVIKHAQPAAARVWLAYEKGAVRLRVCDDGIRRAAPPNGGRGIAGMRERAALYGAELSVGQRAQGGFEVSARFPVEDA